MHAKRLLQIPLDILVKMTDYKEEKQIKSKGIECPRREDT